MGMIRVMGANVRFLPDPDLRAKRLCGTECFSGKFPFGWRQHDAPAVEPIWLDAPVPPAIQGNGGATTGAPPVQRTRPQFGAPPGHRTLCAGHAELWEVITKSSAGLSAGGLPRPCHPDLRGNQAPLPRCWEDY